MSRLSVDLNFSEEIKASNDISASLYCPIAVMRRREWGRIILFLATGPPYVVNMPMNDSFLTINPPPADDGWTAPPMIYYFTREGGGDDSFLSRRHLYRYQSTHTGRWNNECTSWEVTAVQSLISSYAYLFHICIERCAIPRYSNYTKALCDCVHYGPSIVSHQQLELQINSPPIPRISTRTVHFQFQSNRLVEYSPPSL